MKEEEEILPLKHLTKTRPKRHSTNVASSFNVISNNTVISNISNSNNTLVINTINETISLNNNTNNNNPLIQAINTIENITNNNNNNKQKQTLSLFGSFDPKSIISNKTTNTNTNIRK